MEKKRFLLVCASVINDFKCVCSWCTCLICVTCCIPLIHVFVCLIHQYFTNCDSCTIRPPSSSFLSDVAVTKAKFIYVSVIIWSSSIVQKYTRKMYRYLVLSGGWLFSTHRTWDTCLLAPIFMHHVSFSFTEIMHPFVGWIRFIFSQPARASV